MSCAMQVTRTVKQDALHWYPFPPLQTPGLARDGLPGGGGRRSPSDGLPGGGGEIARVLQGKQTQQWPTHVHQVCVSGTVHGHQEKTSWV